LQSTLYEFPPNVFKATDPGGGIGKTITRNHMARFNADFMALMLVSPAAEISARLMRVKEVRFFLTNFMLKNQRPFHQRHSIMIFHLGRSTEIT
tara:strand:+ start:1044 stop:1325 length:282 start_codon:yes stop_codon:yes gene_type:complete